MKKQLNYAVNYYCTKAATDLTFNELRLITDCLAENEIDNYLEVGVWHGATLYHVANLFKLNELPLTAYGYDCFQYGVEGENSHTSGWPDISVVEDVMTGFDNVKLIAGDAADIDKVILDRKFDFVFHDANHTKNAIVKDLIALKGVLNPNAFVAVHNSAWDEPYRNFFGKSAIDQLVGEGYYKFITTADCSTLLQSV